MTESPPGRPGLFRTAFISAVAAYLAATVITAAFRHFPAGPWALYSDDGVWMSILRGWCGGGRLYSELWENKGPLFFLWLRPMCLVPPSPDLLGNLAIGYELTVFWIMTHGLLAAGVAWAAAELELPRLKAAVFGLFAAAVMLNPRWNEFLFSESIACGFAFLALAAWLRNRRLREHRAGTGAGTGGETGNWTSLVLALSVFAALWVNFKFAALGGLYFTLKGLSWRRFGRDAAACALFSAIVLFASIGTDAAAYRSLFMVPFGSSVASLTLAERFGIQSGECFMLGCDHGFQSLLNYPLQKVAGGFIPPPVLTLITGLPVIALLLWGLRKLPGMAAAFGLSWLALSQHLIFTHTYYQLFPFYAVLVALALARLPAHRAGYLTVFVCGTALLWLAADPVLKRSRYETQWRPQARASALRMAGIYRDWLGGREWLSLLSNGYPPLLVNGVSRPVNRTFHNYCGYHVPGSSEEVMKRLRQGNIRVALHPFLAEPICLNPTEAAYTRDHCPLVFSAPDEAPGMGWIEFRDCPPPSGNPPGPAPESAGGELRH